MANRAFRISFDHKVSKFVIEIQGFLGLRWHPARVVTGYSTPPEYKSEHKPEGPPLRAIGGQYRKAHEVRYFNTFKEAWDTVVEMGLNQIYDNFTKEKPWQQNEVQQPRQVFVGHQPLPQGM